MSTPETMRAWARGSYPLVGGVELLIRSGLADRAGTAACWSERGLDVERLRECLRHPWSGGEERLVRLALALLEVDPKVEITDVLSGLGRWHLQLALAALAHAGGSHEHGDVTYDADGLPTFGKGYLPPLVEWPEERP